MLELEQSDFVPFAIPADLWDWPDPRPACTWLAGRLRLLSAAKSSDLKLFPIRLSITRLECFIDELDELAAWCDRRQRIAESDCRPPCGHVDLTPCIRKWRDLRIDLWGWLTDTRLEPTLVDGYPVAPEVVMILNRIMHRMMVREAFRSDPCVIAGSVRPLVLISNILGTLDRTNETAA